MRHHHLPWVVTIYTSEIFLPSGMEITISWGNMPVVIQNCDLSLEVRENVRGEDILWILIFVKACGGYNSHF